MRHGVWAVMLGLAATPGLLADEAILPGGPLALVVHEKVQKELRLTPEQSAAVQKLHDEGGKDARNALVKVLRTEQRRRLEQISLQVRGGSALADRRMVEALNLSRDQARKIAEVWKNEEENLRQVLRVARFRNESVRRRFILDHRRNAGKRMLEVLTEDQLATLKKLQGKPFELTGLER